MSVFFPEHVASSILILVIVLTEFLAGYVYLRLKAHVWISWIFPLTSVTLVHLLTLNEPPGFRMLALIIVLLTGMKVVMATHYPKLAFTIHRWFMYCFLWLGMNPELFFKFKVRTDSALLYRGMLYLVIGISIALCIIFLEKPISIPSGISYYVFSLLILVSLSQILHFGLMNINAFLLQLLHYPAYSLFRAPLQAGSLSDFWGKRWNLAFTELTSVTVYRPLLKNFNPKQAMLASFIFSGVLHEVALSLPVNKGYGLPVLYFLIQLGLTLMEPKIFRQKKPGTTWVILCLVVPLPILFHPAIMNGVFWPVFLRS